MLWRRELLALSPLACSQILGLRVAAMFVWLYLSEINCPIFRRPVSLRMCFLLISRPSNFYAERNSHLDAPMRHAADLFISLGPRKNKSPFLGFIQLAAFFLSLSLTLARAELWFCGDLCLTHIKVGLYCAPKTQPTR
jgi:hypothetical protein